MSFRNRSSASWRGRLQRRGGPLGRRSNGLAKERGDIRALEGPLQDYHRLRVGGYRVVFKYRISPKRRGIQCIFAERRSAVYELFELLLKQHLLRSEETDAGN